MVFEPANPTDTEELRRLGTVIRPNWVAIQQGEATFKPYSINFDNRTALVVADDPTAIADTFIFKMLARTGGNSFLFFSRGRRISIRCI